MANQNDNNRADRILHEYYEGNLSESLNETIQGWLVSDDHAEEKDVALAGLFDKKVQAQKTPDRKTLRSLTEIHKRLGLPAVLKSMRPLFSRIVTRVAAVLIPVFVLLSAYLYTVVYKEDNDSDESLVSVVAETPQSIELPDGSAVLLGENSQIEYDKSGRSVKLRGEAKFEVKKAQDANGEALPFSVSTKELKIDVLGTVFRIIDHESAPGSSLALYQGGVKVGCGTDERQLRPGESLKYDPVTNSHEVSLILGQEMIDNGFKPLLRFEQSNRSNLFLSLEANYDAKFVLPENIDLHNGAISADFEGLSIQEALQVLCLLDNQYAYQLYGGEIRITEK
jgi:ferric-dicitrate binding protein FerR (iron transport regulator)